MQPMQWQGRILRSPSLLRAASERVGAMDRRGRAWFARGGSSSDDDRGGVPYYIFFAAIWLIYLIEPIDAAWKLRSTLHGMVGLVATVLFAAAYLWHFGSSRRFAWADPVDLEPPARPANRALRYAVLAVLALVSTVTLGQHGTATWVFLAVAGLWTFPTWIAVIIAGCLALTYELMAYQVSGWDRDSGVSLSIFLAVLAVGGGMLASRRSKDLSAARRENARLMVEEERNRMARDLHDILGHSLTVITVKAELAGRLIEVAPDRAKSEIDALETLAREALSDVRRAVEGFREISLAGELARAREALTTAGIEPRLPRAVEAVPADLRELYAWGVREGVTNVIRHSQATSCTITIDRTGLRIADNGSGAHDQSSTGAGNGLRGLRERAAAVGGTLATRSVDSGFEVHVSVPEVAGVGQGGAAVGITGSVVHP